MSKSYHESLKNKEEKNLKLSSNQVAKAGKMIRDNELKNSKGELNLEIYPALTTLTNYRELHKFIIPIFKEYIKKLLSEKKFKIFSRLKRIPTIIDKIKNRQSTMKLSTMQDIAGCRIICNNVYDIKKTLEKDKKI